MQNQDIGQSGRHQSLPWQIFKYLQIISREKWMPSTLKTELKPEAWVSDSFNCETTFKMEIDDISNLSQLFP